MRQIHLDFHTSREFRDVGGRFDPADFASTMADADVDSVNVFAKCHHGFSYFPSRIGTPHPGLAFDLLGQQINALHARGIRAPLYLSVLWDDLAGELHPEWIVTNRDGRSLIRRPLSADTPLRNQVGWSTMDIGGGYGDYVINHVAELCARYPVDGFWFDIVWPEPNYSPSGQRRMAEAGVNIEDEAAVQRHAREQLLSFCARLRATIEAEHPNATVFFNGTVDASVRDTLAMQTHLEIESLPTSGDIWGYTHYPVVSRFARTTGHAIVGMTGRFHAAWADFGGLKTEAQLSYEVGTILGAGGAVCIGDQLHPNGRLDAAVYRTIGHAFARIRHLEHLWRNLQRCTEVAVLGDHRVVTNGGHLVDTHTPAVAAAVEVLLELSIQVDIIDPDAPQFEGYRLVIVPDGMELRASNRAALERFRDSGGIVMLSGASCIDAVTGEPALSNLPFTYESPAPTHPAYVRPTRTPSRPNELATDYDYVLYDGAHLVRPASDSQTAGVLYRAEFDRNWKHFTSHMHAPVGACLERPLVVSGHGVVYFAAGLFESYGRHEYWVYRALLEQALEGCLPEQRLIRTGPAWVEATVHAQGETPIPDRYVVNLTAYQPRRSAAPIPRVDESGLTAGVCLSLRPDPGFVPGRVTLEPEGFEVSFRTEQERVLVDLPPIRTHAVVSFERGESEVAN